MRHDAEEGGEVGDSSEVADLRDQTGAEQAGRHRSDAEYAQYAATAGRGSLRRQRSRIAGSFAERWRESQRHAEHRPSVGGAHGDASIRRSFDDSSVAGHTIGWQTQTDLPG